MNMAEQKTIDEMMDEYERICEPPPPQTIRGRCEIADCIEWLYSDEGEACVKGHYDTRVYVDFPKDGSAHNPWEVFDDVESAVDFLFNKDFEDRYEVGEMRICNGSTDHPWDRLEISLVEKEKG